MKYDTIPSQSLKYCDNASDNLDEDVILVGLIQIEFTRSPRPPPSLTPEGIHLHAKNPRWALL